MPKKLVLSSIILHAATLAIALISAAVFLAKDFANIPFWAFFDRNQIYLYALIIGAVVYIANIAFLAKAHKSGVISDGKISTLYASVFGDLCMAFCAFPLFVNHPALALGIAAGCLIVANFVLRMVCAVKLAHMIRARSSDNRHPAPAVPLFTPSAKEKRLSLAAAFTGLACIVLGIALFCVVFRIGIPAFYENVAQNSQDLDTTGQLYAGAIAGFVFAFGAAFFVVFQTSALGLVLSVSIALIFFSRGKKQLSMLGITIALWIMEGLSLVFSLMLLSLLPLHPAVISTAVLLFSAETAQAILCTILAVYRRQHSPSSFILQNPPLTQSSETSEESAKTRSEVHSAPSPDEWSKPPFWRL